MRINFNARIATRVHFIVNLVFILFIYFVKLDFIVKESSKQNEQPIWYKLGDIFPYKMKVLVVAIKN